MAVAKRCGGAILDGKAVSAADRFQYWLGNLMIYGPLRNVMGLSRIRVAYTAGAAIGDLVAIQGIAVGEKLVRRGRPKAAVTKEAVKLRLDADLLAALRATGDGWQTRINDMLRASMHFAGRV